MRLRYETFGKPCFELPLPILTTPPNVLEVSETNHYLGGSFFTRKRRARRGTRSCTNFPEHILLSLARETEGWPCHFPCPSQHRCCFGDPGSSTQFHFRHRVLNSHHLPHECHCSRSERSLETSTTRTSSAAVPSQRSLAVE